MNEIEKSRPKSDLIRILTDFRELNISQNSNILGKSRSTVTRQFKRMEKEEVVQYRIAQDSESGYIPPKLYSVKEE